MTLSPDTIVELDDFLKQPDPPDLPPRRHHVTCEGREDRLRVLVAPLMMTATQWKHVDYEYEPAVGPPRPLRADWVQ